MYIYKLKDWPNFFWDQEKIIPLLMSARHQQGRLIGGMRSIGFHFSEETFLKTLTKDVVKSSEIEGEILDQTLVRSSVARKLGIDVAAVEKRDRNIDGVVEMMLDATQHFDQPLTKDRLLLWHKNLFKSHRKDFAKIRIGEWRKGLVQVVSGRYDKEIVHFEGPPAESIENEMELFFKWSNEEGNIDPVLKSAIGHLWFVTIHPFDDGNGRIGRAIADLFLARSENSSKRFYSLSAQIQKERKEYYEILEKTQKSKLDITLWIEWFIMCLGRAIETSLSDLERIQYKTQFWEKFRESSLNERQHKVINQLIEGFEGKLTTSKWAKMTKCSQDSAYRDILELIDLGILRKNLGGGRNTSYSLTTE